MKSRKTSKNNSKTTVLRIPNHQKKVLEKLGDGNVRNGLTEVLGIHKLVTQQPELILNKDIETYMSHMELFCNENHFEHFVDSGLPALISKFNKTGRIDRNILLSMLNKRAEKPIDDFSEEQEVSD